MRTTDILAIDFLRPIVVAPIVVAGAFFMFTSLTYPLQRAMYLGSLKEFGQGKAAET